MDEWTRHGVASNVGLCTRTRIYLFSPVSYDVSMLDLLL